MKTSKVRRKYVNAMRSMGDVPWPARRFHYAPTFAGVPTGIGCQRLVTVKWQRHGRLLGWVRKPLARPVVCGAELVLQPFRKRINCPDCARRAKRERLHARIEKPPATVHTAFHGVLNVARRFSPHAGPAR